MPPPNDRGAVIRLTLDYPPVWLAGFAALGWVAGRVWPVMVPGQKTLGWVLVAGGLALMAAAAVQMLARRTTLDPHGAPSGLVTGGVFRLTRNPIYLADALLLAGLCLAFAAPHAALLLVPAFVAVITARFIRAEEARLAAAFPDAFPAFRARTRRWL
nr:methyltransferase [Paracoccus sp. S-4012]